MSPTGRERRRRRRCTGVERDPPTGRRGQRRLRARIVRRQASAAGAGVAGRLGDGRRRASAARSSGRRSSRCERREPRAVGARVDVGTRCDGWSATPIAGSTARRTERHCDRDAQDRPVRVHRPSSTRADVDPSAGAGARMARTGVRRRGASRDRCPLGGDAVRGGKPRFSDRARIRVRDRHAAQAPPDAGDRRRSASPVARRRRSGRSPRRSCARAGRRRRAPPGSATDGAGRGRPETARRCRVAAARLMSIPVRSMSSNGPIGKPASRSAASIALDRRRRPPRARRERLERERPIDPIDDEPGRVRAG